jgi:hypothetical protein
MMARDTLRTPCRGTGGWLGALLLAIGAGPGQAQSPNMIDFPANNAGQIIFVMPSFNVECTYTPRGGTPVYRPMDGGPELSCDRRDPKYIRLILTPNSVRRIDDVGDQGCCGTENVFAYGARWSKAPFTCASALTGLTCKRADDHAFVVSRERAELF